MVLKSGRLDELLLGRVDHDARVPHVAELGVTRRIDEAAQGTASLVVADGSIGATFHQQVDQARFSGHYGFVQRRLTFAVDRVDVCAPADEQTRDAAVIGFAAHSEFQRLRWVDQFVHNCK